MLCGRTDEVGKKLKVGGMGVDIRERAGGVLERVHGCPHSLWLAVDPLPVWVDPLRVCGQGSIDTTTTRKPKRDPDLA